MCSGILKIDQESQHFAGSSNLHVIEALIRAPSPKTHCLESPHLGTLRSVARKRNGKNIPISCKSFGWTKLLTQTTQMLSNYPSLKGGCNMLRTNTFCQNTVWGGIETRNTPVLFTVEKYDKKCKWEEVILRESLKNALLGILNHEWPKCMCVGLVPTSWQTFSIRLRDARFQLPISSE